MSDSEAAYRVLARKYRPSTFAELIGQEAMVRTLSNAIATGRIAHAFILTGVRGVGKTTTARILARALNCVGTDGSGGPTAEPCGQCAHCLAIGEDRHIDVMEMDAASRTGVDDIRDLTEGVRYRPVSGRYKVYIIDEVHMLSKNAFNALLKTLEEPPPGVKFVFATTEVNKVPVTVLSRCQRFSLRRVPVEQLIPHYRRIAEAEGVEVEPAALALIARAWQMILKGLEEVQMAPSPIQAAEMVLVRLAYVADLPAPAELVRSLVAAPGLSGTASGSRGNGAAIATASSPPIAVAQPTETVLPRPSAGNVLRAIAELAAFRIEPVHDPMPQSFAEVIALFDKRREALLRSHLWSDVHLVHFEPGRIEVRPASGAPRDITNRLGQLLSEWTGSRWLIAVSEAEGKPTLREQEEGRQRDLRNEVTSHPLVQAVLEAFPGATIAAVRERFAAAEPARAETYPEDPGEETATEEDGA